MADPKLRGPTASASLNRGTTKLQSTSKRRDLHNVLPNGAPVTPATFTNGLSSSLLPKSSLEYPILVNGRDLGFPPTPPSNSREDQTTASSENQQAHRHPNSRVSLSRTSTASAPLSQRNPPTPDGTPPASWNGGWRSKASLLSSSQPDSFRTAREEQWSSDEDDDDSIAEDAVRLQSSRTAPAVQPVEPSIPSAGLGLAGFETEEDDITPTQSRVRISKGLKEIVPDGVSNPLDYIPNREWDTNIMRNVTVRRKRPQPLKPVNTDVALMMNGPDAQPRSPPGSDLKYSPHTPSTATSSNWSPLQHIARSQLRSSNDTKRMSTASAASTIVEAIIIATPTPKPRTLRHVKKRVIIRSESSSSSDSSPISSTIALSLPSSQTSQRTLPQRHVSAVVTPIRRKSPSPPVPLKHHRESLSLRSDAARSVKRPQDAGLPLSSAAAATSRSTSLSNGVSPKRSSGKQPARPRAGLEHSAFDVTPPRVKFTDSTNALADQKEMNQESASSLTRSATQKALKAVMPIAVTGVEIPQATKALPSIEQSPTAADQASPSRIVIRQHSVGKQHSISSSSPTRPFFDNRRHRRSFSLDESAMEDTRRYSFDRSTIGTHDTLRTSLDRSNSQREEHANARHLYSQVTPFSQISDALEVSEATAVNIYPHNNHSLLLVEHGVVAEHTQPPPSAPLVSPTLTSPPAVTFHPSTPPQGSTQQPAVDSPLRNPRPPPQPPSIKVLPATPQDEPAASPLDSAAPRAIRRPSLAQRARRYSDTLLQPLVARTRSLRRSVREPRSRSNSRTRSVFARSARVAAPEVLLSDHDADAVAAAEEDVPPSPGNLHPFWHPRGADDEQRDDDDDDDEEEVYDEDAWDDVLGNTITITGGAASARRATTTSSGRGRGGGVVGGRVRKVGSAGSLGKRAGRDGPALAAPATATAAARVWKAWGLHVEYVGLAGLRDIVRERKARRRRERLKSSIGERWPAAVEAAAVKGAV